VVRGNGITGQRDGIVQHNLFAAYTHQRHCAANPWVTRFLQFVQSQRSNRPAVMGSALGASR
jgi:cobyrinic acid a,c-diamide synthase